MNTTTTTLRNLKGNNEDFEWYPTTDSIITKVAIDLADCSHHDMPKSILDIGAGDGRVLVALQEHLAKSRDHVDMFAIEKATVHLSAMPKDVAVIGTDFLQQTLVDKPVGAVFCNPPYSEFEEWTLRIVREATASRVYLVIPERWRQNVDIKRAIESRDGDIRSLGKFDFEDADRQARAKVEVLCIRFSYGDRDAFDAVIQDMLPELDIFDRDTDLPADVAPEKAGRGMIEGGENVVESLVMAYDAELAKLIDNYRSALQIDLEVLKELNVDKASILKGIRLRIKGLKNKYWQALFDELTTITKRLATKQRAALLESLSGKLSIDFTESNVYALLIWVSKWANDYFDDQLIEVFRTLSTDSNVVKYKSNQRVWTQGDWYYRSADENKASHYRLEYRLVVSHGGIATSDYSWERSENRGLSKTAANFLRDIVTVANNLGFNCDDTPKNYKWESNKQNTLRLKNGEPLVAVRAFKNGNLHLHFNPSVMLAINVEAGRLLGWIRNPAEAVNELQASKDEVGPIHDLFGSSFRIAPDAGLKLGCRKDVDAAA